MEQFGIEAMNSTEPTTTTTTSLLVKHLPDAIPNDSLFTLFSHFGASSVRPSSSVRLKNCAFLDFNNEALANQALRQLNGLRFMGKVLSVERARTSNPNENNISNNNQRHLPKDSFSINKEESASASASASGNYTHDFKSASEPIAPKLGVDYPFPPYLEYAYPPIDGNIITNIVNALIAVPRFYTQVLHLMNKMNIPAPFRMALPTPPLPPSAPAPPQPPLPPTAPLDVNPKTADLSSDESEMEYTDEEVDESKVKHRRKRARKEAIIGPAVNKEVAHEAVGLKPASLLPKEIPIIKKKSSVLQIKILPKPSHNEVKEDNGAKQVDELENKGSDKKCYATPEELEGGKWPPEEILSLPMFKNYVAGDPSSKLYVKNLAKDVVEDDFYFLFGSLFGSTDEAKSCLTLKLYREGRMRRQAFVTFPSVDLAQHALNLVHGYELKGKPIIIQFRRNTSATEEN
ncbi:hypothetical protein ACFE04_024699 [Oxalis oulophora]